MTSLIGARRRAEEFDAALRSGAAPAGSAPELTELLSVVGALREQDAPAPRPDFSARLREQLMAEAAEVLTPATTSLALPPRRKGSRERRLTVAASAFVLIGGSAGMAAAAQNAAPGDALYPIKRGLENAERSIQRDDAGKGRAYLTQADDRLDEARLLAGRDASAQEVAGTLRAFSTQAMTGSDLLLGSYADEADPAKVAEVRRFTAEALQQLDALSGVAPAGLADEIARAGYVLQRIDAAAAQACADCSDLPALKVPEDMALTAQIQQATKQIRINPVDNSHPAVGVRLPSVKAPGTTTTTPKGSSGSQGGGTAPSTALPSPSLPGKDLTTDVPKGAKDLVGQLDDATGGLLGSLGDTTDKVLPKDLTDTTDSLLP